MSQPLGLTPAQEQLYIAQLFRNHDFAVSIDVLQLDHTPIRSLTDTTMDGQVNIQRDSAISRTATFAFDDPDHSLHLDADSPWEGAYYSDRMIQVRHELYVPALGKTVTAIPFVGPITKVSRDGDTLSVECQDKTALALTGGPPVKAPKGMNAVDAIRRIMANAAGENKFRLPSGINRNIQKPGGFSTGWHEDASPWLVCQRIANQLNRQLYYSSDGYLTLRTLPAHPVVTVTGAQITSAPTVDWDASEVANMVRVSGTLAPPKRKKRKADAKPQLERPATKLSAVAVAGPNHPLSPGRLGRNGVARYLPEIIEGSTYKSLAQARALASDTLADDLKLTTGVAWDMIPLFHLDTGDLIVAQTDYGRLVVRFYEASIPLTISGDMSIGYQRRVSRAPHARLHASQRTPPPTRKQRKQYRKDLADWRKKRHHG